MEAPFDGLLEWLITSKLEPCVNVCFAVRIFAVVGTQRVFNSQASFPSNSTKISQYSSLKKVSIWYTPFGYCFSMLN